MNFFASPFLFCLVTGIASADYLTFQTMLSEGEVEGNLFAIINGKAPIQVIGMDDMEGFLVVDDRPHHVIENMDGLSVSQINSVTVSWHSDEPDSQGETITVSSMKIGSVTDKSTVSFCGDESMPMDKQVQLKQCWKYHE